MMGIFLKRIISIKGRCLTCFTNTAIKAKHSEAVTIKKIPAL